MAMKGFLCLTVSVMLAGFLEASLPPENPMPGGFFDTDINDMKVQEMATFAAEEMGMQLVTVLAAQTQTVAGYNYRMELVLRRGGLSQTCIVVVYEKLFDGGKELTSRKCLRSS